MRAEIIAVGTELLLGDVINSNAAWLGKKLAALGIDVYHHVTVGDNPSRIQAVIQEALERTDCLIFTGGLGPTEDDLTIATIADYFTVPLVEDPDSIRQIESFFIARGIQHSRNNLKQALRPAEAEVIQNPIGTAPGIAWNVSERTGKTNAILCFPGVPRELYAMWPQGDAFLQALMAKTGEKSQKMVTRFLHFFGIGESKVAETLADLMSLENPTVAPYVGRSDVRIRLVAKADSQADALALIEPVKATCISRLPDHYFGEGETPEEVAIEALVADLLKAKGLTVSVAESCTGGLVSSRLTDVPGSSVYTRLNLVTYCNTEKQRILQVPETDLNAYGAVSPTVALAMAEGVCRYAQSDIGLSLTGIAGPEGGTEEKPVGLLYVGLTGLHDGKNSQKSPMVKKVMVNRNYSRTDIKYWFSQYALQYLRLYLLGQLVSDVTPDDLKDDLNTQCQIA